MKKQTIQNILDTLILNKLKTHTYLTSDQIVDELEKLCDNSEDLDEMINIVFNSKRFNFINAQNGIGYIFGTSEKNIKAFIFEIDGEISDDDSCWRDYITCEDKSYKLNYFIDKEDL